MAETVYVLCAVTSLLAALLLIRSYRATRSALLLWSSLCFVALALNNLFLVIDMVVAPSMDLSFLRQGTALAGVLLLIVGLIWESR